MREIDPDVSDYLKDKELSGAADKTLYEYHHMLSLFKEYTRSKRIARISRVSRQVAERYIYKLMTEKNRLTGKKLAISTVNGRLTVLKEFFMFLVKKGKLKANPFRLLTYIKNDKKVFKNYLKQSEVKALFALMPEDTDRQKQYKLFLELSYHCGLRISEALSLRSADVDLENKMLLIREGKGGYDRSVPLSDHICRRLAPYLKEHHHLYLFPSAKTGRPLTCPPLRKYLARYVKKGEFKTHVTHHTLRHSIAKHLLERGLDIRYVQKFLGHHSIDSTARYTKLNLEDLRRALMTYHPREGKITGAKYA